jgi:hypothetical protein
VDGGTVRDHQIAEISIGPRELGLVDESTGHFDEEAYQRALTEREEPFRPGLLVHDALGVTRGKVIDALHNAWDNRGEVLWPSGGAKDTPALRRAIATAEQPIMLALPLWEYLATERPSKAPAKKKSKKKK